jgi:hypothetical protein
MGRMIKNAVFKTASHALGVPVGTPSVGPNSPVNGQIRFNDSSTKLEFYSNSSWNQFAKEGTATIVMDRFIGNTGHTEFGPMSYSHTAGREAQVLVFVGAVFQIPGVNYTFYGNTQIHFTSAPSNGSDITLLHNFASTITS